LPAHPEAAVSELVNIEGANLFELDLDWAGEHRQRVIEKWVDEIVGF